MSFGKFLGVIIVGLFIWYVLPLLGLLVMADLGAWSIPFGILFFLWVLWAFIEWVCK